MTELDSGLSTDEQRRVEALHIGAEAINGAQWSEDFADAVSALLHNAPRIETYIRDGGAELRPEDIEPGDLKRSYAAGYAEAVRRLTDQNHYAVWWAGAKLRHRATTLSSRQDMATYLEDTAPDPDTLAPSKVEDQA